MGVELFKMNPCKIRLLFDIDEVTCFEVIEYTQIYL